MQSSFPWIRRRMFDSLVHVSLSIIIRGCVDWLRDKPVQAGATTH